MNFQQLNYVLAVHKEQHFGSAANACNVTQATLSGMIKKLEEELGYLLFDRSRHPILTTELGIEFIALARKVLDQQEAMYALKTEPNKALSGTLHIGIIPTIANALLPNILERILGENPDLQLKIVELTTVEILHQLKQDKLDLAIIATPIAGEELEEQVLYYEAMMVYGIEEGNKKFVSSKDVKNKRAWLLEEGHCFRSQAVTICDIQEKEVGNTGLDFEGNSFETLINLTDRFGGYTLVPELYAGGMPAARKAKVKPFQKPIPVREVSLVSLHSHAHSQAVNYLTQVIQQSVEGLLSTERFKNKDLEIIGI